MYLFCFSLLDPLVQRLQHSCVHRCDHVHRRIQFFFGHPRFPRVREATVDSRIAEPHHRNGETDQHLFALGETLDGVSVAIESSKIGLFHITLPSKKGRSLLRPYKSETSSLSTHSSALIHAGLTPVISA